MTETARILVERMVVAEGWPDPQVLEDILEQGEAAVAPLLDVVGREIYEESDVDVLCHACLLLGSIGATSAIPALIELFYRYDSDLLEDVAQALIALGVKAVEPALLAVRDGSLPWYPRAMAANAAIEAARPDPALRKHVTAELRGLLADYVARAEDLEDEEVSTATSLVMDLAQLADPEARDLIDAAFEADIVEWIMIGPQDVKRLYRKGGATSFPDPHAWLQRYQRHYRERLARERQRRREAQRPKPRAVRADWGQRPGLGRNDPCWCGSGKKYKYCHLRQDQGKA
jgi:hypothetical protein